MNMTGKRDTTVEDALRAKAFDKLEIKRINNECYLVVTIVGETRVLTDKKGKHKTFRHVWQLRNFLREKFDVVVESIPVETYR